MMRNIYKLLIGSLFLMVGCGDDDSSPVLLSSENGKFIDERDGSVYHWVRYGDLEWMVENIRLKTDKGKCQIYSENLIIVNTGICMIMSRLSRLSREDGGFLPIKIGNTWRK